MSRVFYKKFNGRLVAHYRGKQIEVLDGLYEFSKYDIVTMKKFLLGGHSIHYYFALLNSLIMMRGLGSPDEDKYVLREIVGWPLDVQTTTDLIMALPLLARKYGIAGDPVFAKDNLTVSTLTVPQDLPSHKPKSVIFSDLESRIRKAPEKERERLRTQVCPGIVVAFRVMCALSSYNTSGWACSTREDIWGYVMKYFPTSFSTHVVTTGVRSHFHCGSTGVTLDYVGRNVYGPMYLYVTEGYSDVDRYVSMTQDSQVVIISDVELVTRLPFSHYTCESKHVYLLNAPLKVQKLMCDSDRRCLFTDFFQPNAVYRVNTDQEAGMLRSIKYLGAKVCVSGVGRYRHEFTHVVPESKYDIGFIDDKFIVGLKGYVSMTDGKYRYANIAKPKDKEVIEGTFIPLEVGDVCDCVIGSDNVRYAYATRSFKIRKKRVNDQGCVVSMYVVRITVYKHTIRYDDDYQQWKAGEKHLHNYIIN